MNYYIVVCRDDRKEDGSKGDYQLATHKVWKSKKLAEKYSSSISQSRDPLVVEVWHDLNFKIVEE